LTPKGIKIPNGFVVTTEGFKAFMNHNKFYERVHGWLGNLDESNVK
jgi:pyruvate,water dikinase